MKNEAVCYAVLPNHTRVHTQAQILQVEARLIIFYEQQLLAGKELDLIFASKVKPSVLSMLQSRPSLSSSKDMLI